jgi:hypothetical protein
MVVTLPGRIGRRPRLERTQEQTDRTAREVQRPTDGVDATAFSIENAVAARDESTDDEPSTDGDLDATPPRRHLIPPPTTPDTTPDDT